FIVTVAVFSTKVSAEKVAQKNDGAQVYEVVIDGNVIDRNETLISALNIHDQIYDDLYSNLVDFESGKRSESLVLFCVENWVDKTQKIQSELPSEQYSLVINYLEKIKFSLKNLIEDENHGISSRIRCSLCEIVYERAKLSKML
ncbi:MAG: hypothetical protein IKC64_00810, partial [Clostridia bacterium]|nr:hypothetical protein [Clostridia bacterium]